MKKKYIPPLHVGGTPHKTLKTSFVFESRTVFRRWVSLASSLRLGGFVNIGYHSESIPYRIFPVLKDCCLDCDDIQFVLYDLLEEVV